MPSIIEQILQIDSIAQKKLDEANAFQQQLLVDSESRKAELDAAVTEKMEAELAEFSGALQQKTSREKQEMEKQSQEDVSRLADLFAQNRARLEKDIFENIVRIPG